MKKLATLLLLPISTFLVSAFSILQTNWTIASNYSIKFKGTNVEGTLSGLTGTIDFHPDDLIHSSINVSINATTIHTGNDTKDKHAKGEDWFDVRKYPTITFTSESFTRSGNNFIVTGILALHGTKKQIQIPFTFSEDATKGIFEGKLKLNRKEYGINGNFFGFTVGKEIEVTLRIPVAK